MQYIGGEEFLEGSFLYMADKFNVRVLDQTLLDYAKEVSSYSLIVRILAYVIGAFLLFFTPSFPWSPFLITLLSILAELLQWRSDNVKSTAESLLRKLEYYDGYGWSISKTEVSDIIARSPRKIRNSISYREPGYQYFESEVEVGSKRTLENLIESAWWSKHLAETAGHFFLTITVLIILGSLTILIVSIESISNFSTLMNISRIVTSTILLLFSLRLIRHTAEFYAFSRKAEQSESKAIDLLKIQNFDEDQSIKALLDYQFARNKSPLIPTWIWKVRRATLNDLWKTFNK